MKRKIFFQLKHIENLTNDQIILGILKQTNASLPLNFISEICGIPKDRCCRVLQSLERYGCVKKSTVQQAAFFKIAKKETPRFSKPIRAKISELRDFPFLVGVVLIAVVIMVMRVPLNAKNL